ncbi:MAG: ribonuclease T [Gammaproteobacteria bacterium]|nr:ribonuclease T [Gammaproteobacteria bacterium]
MTEGRDETPLGKRFRGFLPIVVDVETGGFNPQTDALLEIAAVIIKMDAHHNLVRDATHSFHVKPFAGANIEPAALEVTGIVPDHPLRPALPEDEVLRRLFREVRAAVRLNECNRAILVGHNAFFDLHFLNAAVERCQIKRNPFHPFSSFDTATLGGVAFGQTVLARAVEAAGIEWDNEAAHSAAYDAEKTADLFCSIVNKFKSVFDEI